MNSSVADLAHRLAREAEAVCRHYLSNGCRVGNYWQVGDVRNTAGRSMFVRLTGRDGGRRAGKWTDAATSEHGDLLDVIRESCGLVDFRDVAEEARRFLSLPRPDPEPDYRTSIISSTDRLAAIGAASVRDVGTDCRDVGRNLSASPRHH